MTETFDYVVVGAGSAGAVLAARLTENDDTTVLLLEAGGEADADEVRIPAAFASLFKTKWDWNYQTTPQKQLGGRRAYWPRMQALRGCSSMNAMIYIRGNRHDFDTWRDDYGATGWGAEDCLPYFVRAEGNTRLGAPWHGTDGPLRVEDRRYTHELTHAWVESAQATGFAASEDFNAAAQEGAGLYQVTCRKGRRWSVADAYLTPVLERRNLTVRTGALAEQVVLEGDRAVGVTYRHGPETRTSYADGEVLLAGGAINSPQLLMLSGIGPADHLRETGIDVRVDHPQVGENLHDHPAVPLLFATRATTDLVEHNNPLNFLRASLAGRGPLTSNVGEGGGFWRTRPELPAPDLQAHVAPTGFWDNGMHEPGQRMFTAAPTLLTPASRGRLRLRSDDPRWHPELDPAYFDDPADLDTMVAGARQLWETTRTGPLAGFVDRPVLPDLPPGQEPTEERLRQHVRDTAQTLYHPVGTCAMGDDERAVVDPGLRVRGLEALRVVDASVMPQVTRGNTNAPTVMIAEKVADLIRANPPEDET